MKLIPFLIAVLLLPLNSFTQESAYKNMPLVVIASNGLKLREGPGTKHKVLSAAPFGAEVTMLGFADIPYDTAATYITKNSKQNNDIHHILGSWLKVRWNNLTGYMYSSYLHPKCPMTSVEDNSTQNSNYRMFWSQNPYQCNISDPSKDYWYKVEQDSLGNSYLKAVKIEFLNHFSKQNEGGNWNLFAKEKEKKVQSMNYVIVSKNKLKQGKIPSISLQDRTLQSKMRNGFSSLQEGKSNKEFIVAKNNLLRNFHLKEELDEKNKSRTLYFIRKGKEFPLLENYGQIYEISLIADIDGDGILDYLIRFGDEKDGFEGLFLSTEAETGKSHKLVAKLSHSYNC